MPSGTEKAFAFSNVKFFFAHRLLRPRRENPDLGIDLLWPLRSARHGDIEATAYDIKERCSCRFDRRDIGDERVAVRVVLANHRDRSIAARRVDSFPLGVEP